MSEYPWLKFDELDFTVARIIYQDGTSRGFDETPAFDVPQGELIATDLACIGIYHNGELLDHRWFVGPWSDFEEAMESAIEPWFDNGTP